MKLHSRQGGTWKHSCLALCLAQHPPLSEIRGPGFPIVLLRQRLVWRGWGNALVLKEAKWYKEEIEMVLARRQGTVWAERGLRFHKTSAETPGQAAFHAWSILLQPFLPLLYPAALHTGASSTAGYPTKRDLYSQLQRWTWLFHGVGQPKPFFSVAWAA